MGCVIDRGRGVAAAWWFCSVPELCTTDQTRANCRSGAPGHQRWTHNHILTWDSQTQKLLLQHNRQNNGLMVIILSQKHRVKAVPMYVFLNISTFLSTDSIKIRSTSDIIFLLFAEAIKVSLFFFFLKKQHLQIESTVDTGVKLTRVYDGGFHLTTTIKSMWFTDRSWLQFAENCCTYFASVLNQKRQICTVFHQKSAAHTAIQHAVHHLWRRSAASCCQSPWKQHKAIIIQLQWTVEISTNTTFQV